MTLAEINTKITSLTGASTSQYTNAQRVIDINIWVQKAVFNILDCQDETDYDDPNWGDTPRNTTSLTTSRKYSLPVGEKILKLKSLSISYDGVNYYKATPRDTTELEISDAPLTATTAQATIDANFARTEPVYDVKNNYVYIYPAPVQADVDAGGKIFMEWERQAKPITESDLSTGTLVLGFDDTFHPYVCYGASFEYLMGKDAKKADKMFQITQDYEARMRKQYGSKQLDRKWRMDIIQDNFK